MNVTLKIIPFVVVFLLSLFNPTDADLGWHLRYGEYVIDQHQLLTANTLSQALPDYKWVNVSWLTDIVDYVVYHSVGFMGLTLLSAILITAYFYVLDRTFDPPNWVKIIYPLALWVGFHMFAYSFRGQIVSFVFLGIEACLLYRYSQKQDRWIYSLIPLFLVWANMHGQFVVGLAFLVLWVAGKSLKTISWQMLLIVLLVMLATLIHPFGFRIYTETFSFLGNPNTSTIIEWLAPNGLILGKLIIWLGFVIWATVRYWQRQDYELAPIMIFTWVLVIFSLFSRRYTPSLLAVSLPLILVELKTIKLRPFMQNSAIIFGVWIGILLLMFPKTFVEENHFNFSWETYCNRYYGCSPEGAKYLIDQQLTENVFTPYVWGGWLIWNYPEIKPYSDGRMNLWKDDDVSPYSNSYGWENGTKHIDDSPFQTVFIGKSYPLYNYISQLPDWKQIYEDNLTGIFVRNEY